MEFSGSYDFISSCVISYHIHFLEAALQFSIIKLDFSFNNN